MNRSRALISILLAVIYFLLPANPSYSGQVVTDEQRDWAAQVLKEEKKGGYQLSGAAANTLAVLYFYNKSGETQWNPLQKGLAVMLITDLSKVDIIQVVERIQLQAILEEIGLGASGLVDQDTIPRLGKLLGAGYVSSGDILKDQIKTLMVDPAILDVADETILNLPYAYGEIENLVALEKELLFSIISRMKIELAPEEKANLKKPLSISIPALLAFFLGIDHSDKGQYDLAAEQYSQALNLDPNLKLAAEALLELEALGLIAGKAIAKNIPSGEGAPTDAAVSGGWSGGKIVLAGVGVAAVAGGVAVAAGSSGSDDGDSSGGGGTSPPSNIPTAADLNGNYHVAGPVIEDPCNYSEDYGSSIDSNAPSIEASGSMITIHSSVDMTGSYNSDTGAVDVASANSQESFNGTAHISSDGTVTISGTLTFIFPDGCPMKYNVTYTKR